MRKSRAATIDRQAVRVIELAVAGACSSVDRDQHAVRRELLEAILVSRDVHEPLTVELDAARLDELPGRGSIAAP